MYYTNNVHWVLACVARWALDGKHNSADNYYYNAIKYSFDKHCELAVHKATKLKLECDHKTTTDPGKKKTKSSTVINDGYYYINLPLTPIPLSHTPSRSLTHPGSLYFTRPVSVSLSLSTVYLSICTSLTQRSLYYRCCIRVFSGESRTPREHSFT